MQNHQLPLQKRSLKRSSPGGNKTAGYNLSANMQWPVGKGHKNGGSLCIEISKYFYPIHIDTLEISSVAVVNVSKIGSFLDPLEEWGSDTDVDVVAFTTSKSK